MGGPSRPRRRGCSQRGLLEPWANQPDQPQTWKFDNFDKTQEMDHAILNVIT
jgi:hypothetical protein